MKVKDVLSLAKVRLKNIVVGRDEEALIAALNMGVSDLYNRFNLLIKAETLDTFRGLSVYTLSSNDVLMLLCVFGKDGKELREDTLIDSDKWEYKQINYNTFMCNLKECQPLQAIYKASPQWLGDPEDEIILPMAFIEALLLFIAWVINSTISSPASAQGRYGKVESDSMYQRYNEQCQMLENQGYKININTERLSLFAKGYV